MIILCVDSDCLWKHSPPLPHGVVKIPSPPWLPDYVVTYSCDINYQLKSGSENICKRVGWEAVWSEDVQIKCIQGTDVCL